AIRGREEKTGNSGASRLPGRARRFARARFSEEEPPLRSELFSADRMEQHGKNLALAHALAPRRTRDLLLSRLAANEAVLVRIRDVVAPAATGNRRITPAADWLLDNFYLIEEQIRTAKRHLPKGYSRELPRLASGASAKLPRVYDLAFEAISHGDGWIDAQSLSRFVAAYQTVAPLRMGELWAVPIMLRLALIENLRRVGARIAASTIDRNRADAWADQMMDVAERDPKSLILVIADMARSNPPMVSSFVAELARRLQGQSAALALPLTWIEQRLSESGLTIEHLVQQENQEQARDQVSIGNTIGSLRFLGAMDWREFVESMSAVEEALREDPGGVYGRMDFATRDRYRHVVEELARRGDADEGDVARKAVELAREAAHGLGAEDDRAAHVGYYLVDKGRRRLESSTGAGVSWPEKLRRTTRRISVPLYLGCVAAITAAITAVLLASALHEEPSTAVLAALAILLVLAASHLAVGMANWLATLLVAPRALARMDFSRGIPPQSRTLVVVPSMLTDAEGIEALLEALEVRFLANRDDRLHFALLTDFRDASAQSLPEDASLARLARVGVEALNRKYPRSADADTDGASGDAFYLFHRPRRWNPSERIWMGYERKRGKLADLNALLRGGANDRFSLVVGDLAALAGLKYVITLDTDTQLPRDSARQLVGVSLPGANRSWYARMHGGDAGIDPYTRAVSDVYQDAFGEGSFIGKGIYDLDAF